jgi:YD repeat-containing protein
MRIANIGRLARLGLLPLGALLSFVFSTQAQAETAYEWSVGYIPGFTWHSTPQAALDEYERLYEHTGGCANSVCRAEVVYLTPATWPTFDFDIRYWDANGNLHGVSPGLVGARIAGTAKYYVSPARGPGCNCVGDPVDPSSGAVLATYVDVTSPASPLRFARSYNSTDTDTTHLGPGWRHSFTRHIASRYSNYLYRPPNPPEDSSLYDDAATACTSGFGEIKSRVSNWQNATATYSGGTCNLSVGGSSIGSITVFRTTLGQPQLTPVGFDVTRDDGQFVSFNGIGTSIVAPPGIALHLEQTTGGFKLVDEQDNVELYNTSGTLLSVTTRAGVVLTLAYGTGGRLSTVTDSYGHQLTLTYNTANALGSVTDPNGQTVQYGYDSAFRLTSVTQRDGTTQSYVYENTSLPNAVTGLIDENGQRHSTWTYDTQGRGTGTSEAGGANAVTLTYNVDGTVTTTDALSAARTFTFGRFGDRSLVAGISGSQCPTCSDGKATTYDSGGFRSSRTDYNNNVTLLSFDDARGLETSRTEASGTPRARTITSAWHSTFRLPALITEPARTTAFTRDTAGNALTRTITDTSQVPNVSRTWTYTYV